MQRRSPFAESISDLAGLGGVDFRDVMDLKFLKAKRSEIDSAHRARDCQATAHPLEAPPLLGFYGGKGGGDRL